MSIPPPSHRAWVCPDCGSRHDRDTSAAIDIRKYALQEQEQSPVGIAGAGRAVEPADLPQ